MSDTEETSKGLQPGQTAVFSYNGFKMVATSGPDGTITSKIVSTPGLELPPGMHRVTYHEAYG